VLFRELPETIIPQAMASEFEDAAAKKGDGMEVLIQAMPVENRLISLVII